MTHNNLSLILHPVVININDIREIAFLCSDAMNHGIAQVCIQIDIAVIVRNIKQEVIYNDVAKIRESFGFLKSELAIINGSFKMIGR